MATEEPATEGSWFTGAKASYDSVCDYTATTASAAKASRWLL